MKKAIIVLTLSLVLWGVSGILPTFDDYTTLQSPQFTPLLSYRLLPADGFWRPFDYLFGWLLGCCTWLFPWLNHVFIIVGHTLSTVLVYTICRRLIPYASYEVRGTWCENSSHLLTFSPFLSSALFFFFSPATLGATLAVDGLNQTYAQLWGLMALWYYLFKVVRTPRPTLIPYLLFLILAALSKENGLAWAVVPPLVASAFGLTERRQLLRHELIGMLIVAGYVVVRIMLTPHLMVGEEYLATTLSGHLSDLAQLLAYTWVPLDYASVVYAPTRCWPLAVLTLMLALPFLACLLPFRSPLRPGTRPQLLMLLACYFILAAPHLLTLTSIMHNYAPLSMAALIVATLLAGRHCGRLQSIAFIAFLLAALITDVHHYQAARDSGEMSRRMANEVISQSSDHAADSVFCISVSRTSDVHGYSSFYVRPVNAFAWGLSVRRYTNYQYPVSLRDTTLFDPTAERLHHVADSALHAGATTVWIVSDSCYHVTVIEKLKNKKIKE